MIAGSTIPASWSWVSLEEVASRTANAIADGPFGSNLKLEDYVDAGIPVLQGKNVTGDVFSWSDIRFVTAKKAHELRRSTVVSGDILIVKIGSIGYSAIASDLQGFDRAIIPANLAKVTINEGVIDRKYLHKWLTTPVVKDHLRKSASQTAQPALSLSKIKSIPVPLPSLAEQRRIAAVLDAAEALRAKRRAAAQRTGDLLRSAFYQLFGDPVSNIERWPLRAIGDIGEVVTGNTPPRSNAGNYGHGIEWIKSDNINTPSHYLTPAVERLSAQGEQMGRVVPVGSILVTCIAGSPDCIGNAAIANRRVAFNQQINALIPRHGTTEFIYTHLLVGKKLVQNASTEGMKGIVSKGKFEAIRLIWPPVEMQVEFTHRFAEIERMAEAQRASRVKLDDLFQSLQHRAFRGEL